MNEFKPHYAVVGQGMVIGLVITKFVFYWAQKDFEPALGFAVLDSVKMHVYG